MDRQLIRRINEDNENATDPGQVDGNVLGAGGAGNGDTLLVDEETGAAKVIETGLTNNDTDSQPGVNTAPAPAPAVAAASASETDSLSPPTTAEHDEAAVAKPTKGGGKKTPVEPISSSSPTMEPTRTPSVSPSSVPSTSDKIPEQQGGDTATDPCVKATTCESCSDKAEQLSSDSSTCWWTDQSACVQETKDEHDFHQRCPEAAVPWEADSESIVPLMSGLAVLLIVVIVLLRKLCSSRILAVDRGSSEHGKYQGLCVHLRSRTYDTLCVLFVPDLCTVLICGIDLWRKRMTTPSGAGTTSRTREGIAR